MFLVLSYFICYDFIHLSCSKNNTQCSYVNYRKPKFYGLIHVLFFKINLINTIF